MIAFSFFLACTSLVLVAGSPNGCHNGESFWCQTEQNARLCDAYEYCQTKVWTAHGMQDSNLCRDCKLFLQDILGMVFGPGIQQAATDRMKQMCSELPSQISDYCNRIAVDWVSNLFDFLESNINEKMICERLALCEDEKEASKHKAAIRDFVKVIKTVVTEGASDSTCNTCQQVVNDVKAMVEDQDFESGVEEVVTETVCVILPPHLHPKHSVEDLIGDQLCRIFPNSTFDKCKEQLRMFGSMFFDIIRSQIDPQVMCEMMKLCPTATKLKQAIRENMAETTSMMRETLGSWLGELNAILEDFTPLLQQLAEMKQSSSSECTLCEMMAKQITHVMKNEHSQDKLVTRLKQVCEYLPEPIASECAGFLDDNGRAVIDMFIKQITPRMICEAVGMCQPSQPTHDRAVSVKTLLQSRLKFPDAPANNDAGSGDQPQPKPLKQTPWCTVCHDVTGIFKTFVGSRELEIIGVSLADGVCSMFMGNAKFMCESVARRSVDAILGEMNQIADPSLVCGNCTPDDIEHPTPVVLENHPNPADDNALRFHSEN